MAGERHGMCELKNTVLFPNYRQKTEVCKHKVSKQAHHTHNYLGTGNLDLWSSSLSKKMAPINISKVKPT
jgi:hypothetical protein